MVIVFCIVKQQINVLEKGDSVEGDYYISHESKTFLYSLCLQYCFHAFHD